MGDRTQDSLGMAEDYLSKFCLRRPDVKSERSLSMFKSLAGRTAVVTGASKGIGRGIARRLGAVGCSVLVVARNTAETENVVREIMQAGGKASAFRADVADEVDGEGGRGTLREP